MRANAAERARSAYRAGLTLLIAAACYEAVARSGVFPAALLPTLPKVASTLLTSNRPVEDWGKLLGDAAAVTAMLDRLLHHGHVLKCGPRSWRTKLATATAAESQ